MARYPITVMRQAEAMKLFAEARVNKGMISDIDPGDLPLDALSDLLNARCRIDKTSRRSGTSLWTPSAPNSQPVLLVFVFRKKDGTRYILRFTPSTIHSRGVGSWTLLTTGTALTGGVLDRFQAAVVLNELCFTNGIDRIYKMNAGVTTYDPITAAPKAKFITGFFNRLVAANLNLDGGNPADFASVAWSADGDVTIWDPLVDASAGKSPIVESPSDLGDAISGIFGGTNIMILLREFSVWIATKQPVASNPFNFQAVIPGLGCNVPHSAHVIPGGIAWYDARSGAVWAYPAGGQHERISYGKIEKELSRGITDPATVFSSYSESSNESSICVPTSDSAIVRKWVYNWLTKAWSYDEILNVTCVADLDYAAPTLKIDDLQGTIDQLQGTIDSLVASGVVSTSHILGRSDGTILEEDVTQDTDAGSSYTTRFASKDFSTPVLEDYWAQLKFEYSCDKPGTLTLEYSTDRGENWKTAKTHSMPLTKSRLFTYNRVIKSRNIRWRLSSSNGLWSLLGYEIHYYPGGKQKP